MARLFLDNDSVVDLVGDGRTDILKPMSTPPELPKWYILRATNGIHTFDHVDAGNPFDAQFGEAGVTLADPRAPRVAAWVVSMWWGVGMLELWEGRPYGMA